VNIFDEKAFKQVVEAQGDGRGAAAKADTIAHATKKAISERLEQDPAFYEKFSRLIQQAIDDYRAKRISDLEYLKKVGEIRDAVVTRRGDDAPRQLAGNDNALAVFGVLRPFVATHLPAELADSAAADAAIAIWAIVQRNRKVGFWQDVDAQRRTMNQIDDYLYDEVKAKRGVSLAAGEMDEIIERTMQIARHRMQT